MKARLKAMVCSLLAGMMLATAIPMSAQAAEKAGDTCTCGYAPIILVNGVNTCDIVATDASGEERIVFPPSGDAIKSALLNKDFLSNVGIFLVTRNWDYLGDALIPAVDTAFADSRCGLDGKPVNNSIPDWDYATCKLPNVSNHGGFEYANFRYDWRLDPMDLAQQLSDFIERVCEATGHQKVNLVGFSMGSVVTMAYLSRGEESYERVNSVVLSAPAFKGVVTCGQPFAREIDVDGLAVARFIDQVLGDDEQSEFIKSLVNLLWKMKVIDGVGGLVNKLVEKQGDRVYDSVLVDALGLMPGLWSLVGDEYYEAAKADFFGDNPKYADFVKIIDNYHNNVQLRSDELIQELFDREINFGIVSKYGGQLTPCITDWDAMGDTVIGTAATSFGATCSTLEGTLGDGYKQAVQCGHNHLSPDGQIDASTCEYPEMTWFVRDLLHPNSCNGYDELVRYILYADEQPTVGENNYPQFYISDGQRGGSMTPMTDENCALGESISSYTFARTLKDFGSSLVSFIKSKISAD